MTPLSLEHRLDRLHAHVRANPLLQRFTRVTRILLAIGFIPPSLVKIQGERFTSLATDTPIGYFFEAMYRTGAYWQFIGWAQLVAAILLLIPRTATLGALAFLPIIVNIVAITVSLRFAGTEVVAAMMLMACVYLICWDFHRWKSLIWSPTEPVALQPISAPLRSMELAAYAGMMVSGLCVALAVRGYAPMGWLIACFVAGTGSALLLAAVVIADLGARRGAGSAA